MAQAVSEFQSLLTNLAGELENRITTLVSRIQPLAQSDLLNFVSDSAPDLLSPYLAAAADLTAVWYEDQDPTSDFRATPVDLPPAADIAASARWAVLQPDPVAAWSGKATKYLFDASRQTVVTNADREGVKWARHAEENACGFCRMLAVKGYFYHSRETALAVRHTDAVGHDNCHCTAVAERTVGYSPPSYLEQWKRDYQEARRIAGKKASAIANAMDYLPGGRRYKGGDTPTFPTAPRKPPPVNLDVPSTEPASTAAADAATAKRLLPGFEQALANLRAQGLPESDQRIQFNLRRIAELKKQLALR